MKLRVISLGCLICLSLFMFGCSNKDNNNKLQKSENEIVDNQLDDSQNEKIDVEDLKLKMMRASYSSEENPTNRTIEEALEYVKQTLPEGIKEIERSYESEVGVTKVTYAVDGLNFEVRYMHPYKEDGNGIDEYDLKKTVGIDFGFK
ncbi:hypothetical protein [Paraclostridium bifermentans]|uniref:hypothetical protein n=1 Tax=Paraclostridium bifermentans TaxID=1490 RepID=UPI00359C3710